jgi:hypothetical protein
VWVFGGTNKIDLINEILPENNYHSIADILRIPEKYRKYRYANISQVFKGFKSTDILGDSRKSPKMAISAISH